ncbi:hypothetical protein [Pseudoalteromonas sp. S2755]|uniref:hypothetical protein n=1 Tax=Pseudoalteromonas sp. S2755 TaxID=2066523 RepID=UPI00201699C6|nr:hypothetical protein [Pseudoalteromonas sp. S2755]
MKIKEKLKLYQLSLIVSMAFALVGFSYNIWRLEETERNNNIRTACFEMLKELAELEQLIYLSHYDKDIINGNPRKGWIKVGLLNDFSYLTNDAIKLEASTLSKTWSENWQSIQTEPQSVTLLVQNIDEVRGEIKILLSDLD